MPLVHSRASSVTSLFWSHRFYRLRELEVVACSEVSQLMSGRWLLVIRAMNNLDPEHAFDVQLDG
eukprot:scaffold88591_cov48-Cyclotella_meneghiniana.AAC.1